MENQLTFMGTYEVAIDEKNRVMIPTRWKNFIEKEMIIHEGFEGALLLWNRSQFWRWYQTMEVENNLYSKSARVVRRKIIGSVRELQLDKWFRFVIPSGFNRNFKDSITMKGIGENIEIWHKNDYEEWSNSEENEVSKAAEDLTTRSSAGSSSRQ